MAEVPGDIRVCFSTLTGRPAQGAMTERQLFALVSKLRRSEVSKSACGKRLLNIYDSQAQDFLR